MAKAANTVTIDGTQYEVDSLSKEARAALVNLQLTEGEIKRLRVQLGIAQTAQRAFAAQLKAGLPAAAPAKGKK